MKSKSENRVVYKYHLPDLGCLDIFQINYFLLSFKPVNACICCCRLLPGVVKSMGLGFKSCL